MATFLTLPETTDSFKDDEFILRQAGEDKKISREELAAGVANSRWVNTVNYDAYTLVTGSNGVVYRAKKASGPDWLGFVDPTTDTSNVSWESYDDIYLPRLGGSVGAIDVTGNITSTGIISEQGERVYSPNNKPTAAELGLLDSGSSAVSAAKWSVARTLTTTLIGGVTGTASMSVDGSSNKTVTILTAVGNDSHEHSANTITAGVLHPDRLPTASTSQYGATKLVDSISSTSTELAATANATRIAYNKGNEALSVANSKWAYTTATTSSYGATILSSAINSTSTSIAANSFAVKAAYDLATSKITKAQGDSYYLGKSATASNASTLDGIGRYQFLRSDQSDAMTAGSLTLYDGVPLYLGSGNDISHQFNGTDYFTIVGGGADWKILDGNSGNIERFKFDVDNGQLSGTSFKGALVGNADTATKLKTARTISLSGDASGSGSFDGSGNIDIPISITGLSTETWAHYNINAVTPKPIVIGPSGKVKVSFLWAGRFANDSTTQRAKTIVWYLQTSPSVSTLRTIRQEIHTPDGPFSGSMVAFFEGTVGSTVKFQWNVATAEPALDVHYYQHDLILEQV